MSGTLSSSDDSPEISEDDSDAWNIPFPQAAPSAKKYLKSSL